MRDAYGLRFAATVSLDSTLMYPALTRGDVDKATPEEAARWQLGRARLAPARCP